MAADLFLKLTGITGESLDQDHPDEIEIMEWSWKMTNSAGHKLGPKDASAKSVIESVTIEKTYDKASVTLVQYLALGQHIDEAVITCRKNIDQYGKLDYLIIKLKNVMITEINWKGGGSAREGSPEVLKLSFLQFDLRYTMQGNAGYQRGNTDFRFDIPKHEAI